MNPVYIESLKSGLLSKRKTQSLKFLDDCSLCPRNCRINRNEGESGICRTGRRAVIASYSSHFGEEAPLVGHHGSGTIFFSNCNLLCNFCQNFDISHEGIGIEVTGQELAGVMLELQSRGCHNINFVTPSHVVPQILESIEIAASNGLNIPLVYNSGSYDNVESLQLLDGIIDIYMPDIKFFDRGLAIDTCNAHDYPEVAKQAVKEMHRQVGNLVIENGIAKRGLLVRHLVMPGYLNDTKKILEFISTDISSDTYVNLMPQYRPCGLVWDHEHLGRRITDAEYRNALSAASEIGLWNIDNKI
jgi:putative pyruvate formate lyase activating enzyme